MKREVSKCARVLKMVCAVRQGQYFFGRQRKYESKPRERERGKRESCNHSSGT